MVSDKHRLLSVLNIATNRSRISTNKDVMLMYRALISFIYLYGLKTIRNSEPVTDLNFF